VTPSRVTDRRVRVASLLVGVGLLVEILFLRGLRPPAFLVFVLVGIPLVAAGILVFLYSLISVGD